MMKDVSDGKIVSQRGIDERSRSDKHRQERRHTGATGRFRQPIANGIFADGCDNPDYKAVAGQRQSE
jgi:hypothetical protein